MHKVVDNTKGEALPTLSDETKKDVRIVGLELQNLGLQIQALQTRYKEMQATARVFEQATLKAIGVDAEANFIDFGTGNIIKR